MKKMICVLILLAMSGICFTSVAADAEYSGKQEHYVYPIDVTSESWFDYTVLEKSEMLRINDETLGKMTDENLVYAIADSL